MDLYNLGVVFSPNLIRGVNNEMSITAIGPINVFIQYLYVLENHDLIFIK